MINFRVAVVSLQIFSFKICQLVEWAKKNTKISIHFLHLINIFFCGDAFNLGVSEFEMLKLARKRFIAGKLGFVRNHVDISINFFTSYFVKKVVFVSFWVKLLPWQHQNLITFRMENISKHFHPKSQLKNRSWVVC